MVAINTVTWQYGFLTGSLVDYSAAVRSLNSFVNCSSPW